MTRYRAPHTYPWPQVRNTGGWRERAACRGHELPPHYWDDDLEGARETPGQRHRRITRAKAVCRDECPVRDACWADVDDDDTGVHGGVDLREWREEQRRRAEARYAGGAA